MRSSRILAGRRSDQTLINVTRAGEAVEAIEAVALPIGKEVTLWQSCGGIPFKT